MATEGQFAPLPETEDDAEQTPAVRHPLVRPVLPVIKTFADWWREMILLGLVCFGWLVLSMTVIAGPPAGAALYAAARGTALHQHVDIPFLVSAFRAYFVRSWLLGLVGVLGLALWWLDLLLYVSLAADGGAVAWAGWAIIFYMGIIWLHTLSYAWALMVCRDDLRLLPLLRNGLLLTLRYPGHTIANSVVGGVFLLVAMYAPPLLGLILPALVALLGLHSLYMLAPELVPDDADMLRVVG